MSTKEQGTSIKEQGVTKDRRSSITWKIILNCKISSYNQLFIHIQMNTLFRPIKYHTDALIAISRYA